MSSLSEDDIELLNDIERRRAGPCLLPSLSVPTVLLAFTLILRRTPRLGAGPVSPADIVTSWFRASCNFRQGIPTKFFTRPVMPLLSSAGAVPIKIGFPGSKSRFGCLVSVPSASAAELPNPSCCSITPSPFQLHPSLETKMQPPLNWWRLENQSRLNSVFAARIRLRCKNVEDEKSVASRRAEKLGRTWLDHVLALAVHVP